jgi:hypothetical protein
MMLWRMAEIYRKSIRGFTKNHVFGGDDEECAGLLVPIDG